ncbi:hypothetical protein [Hymenobacter chitinivorans]|uniref:Uncharacterized protein n=1 Tax=Hymenobacter chitinivorans DSM 11115 TaxID=1121954 RepID=A0A2M9BSF3_9BACT|nr:hypothetical protein [Hymenobacter chitinivorans]PJJ60875.1 hypothetical protein CLV45_2309 [Hymenobacter chitinivorans DSM 11115]
MNRKWLLRLGLTALALLVTTDRRRSQPIRPQPPEPPRPDDANEAKEKGPLTS